MVRIEQLTAAALAGEGLALRALAQDWLRENPAIDATPHPSSDDPMLLAVAAGLVEMFAARRGQASPAWADAIGHAPQSVFLVRAAERMQRLRALCQEQAPLALRKRGIYAPPDFLVFV